MDRHAAQLARLARAANPGTRVVLYQSPAARNGDPDNAREIPEVDTYEGMQRRINATYRRIAGQIGGTLAPAGEAWQVARRQRPDIDLYEDEIHPSREGAYLVACVFYATLFEREPEELTFTGVMDSSNAVALRGFASRSTGH